MGSKAEETSPTDSAGNVEREKATCRHAVCASKQSRERSQHGDKTAEEHYGATIAKKQILPDQQAVFIKANVSPVFVKQQRPYAAPDRVSDGVSYNCTCGSRGHDDGYVDPMGRGSQKGSGNEDRLARKRNAGAFQCNDAEDDPRSVGLNKTQQKIRQ